MKTPIETVTVCVGYADFLRVTAAENIGLFDRWIIVTSPEDIETRDVCRRFNLEVILTDEHKKHDGEAFSKGRIIEKGLRQLSANCWRLHLDADIVVPRTFHHLLEMGHLDTNKIYGCDRIMIRSYEQWLKFKNSGWLIPSYNNQIRFPEGYPVGTRWGDYHTGWLPIGFFQLWHGAADEWRGSRIKPYPEFHGQANRGDVQMAQKWDRRQRELLGELIVVHLESEKSPCGVNWNGRKSKRFGPEPAAMQPPIVS